MYDLESLKKHAEKVGLEVKKIQSDALIIQLQESVLLEFQKLPEEEDTLVGFSGTPWHFHGTGIFEVKDRYIEANEFEILSMIKDGRLLVFEQYAGGILQDRCLVHKNELVEVNDIKPSEEIRVKRV